MEGSCRLGAVITVLLVEACACDWAAAETVTGSSLSNLDTARYGGMAQQPRQQAQVEQCLQ